MTKTRKHKRVLVWLGALLLMCVSGLLLIFVPDYVAPLDGFVKTLAMLPGLSGVSLIIILFVAGSPRQQQALDSSLGRFSRFRARVLHSLWTGRR